MKFTLAVVLVCLSVIKSTEAFWGWPWRGGLGLGYRYGALGGLYNPYLGLGGLYNPYVGLGYPYYGKRTAETTNRVECIVLPTKNLLNCNQGAIECQILPRYEGISKRFDMFGIELVENKTLRLYPKMFTDSSFSDYKVALTNGNMAELSIYPIGLEGSGIMVKDNVCYSKMIELFKQIKSPVKADVLLLSKVEITGIVLEL